MRKHNATALRWHQRRRLLGGPILEVHMAHNAPTTGAAAAAAQAFAAKPGFHELTHIAVGARVIFNTTDNKSTGATNSKQGTVQEVHTGMPPPGVQAPPLGQPWVTHVLVKLDDGGVATVERSIFERAHPNGVPIYRATFPIQLAYAMTAHRAQGATIHGVTIIDVLTAFAAGIVYVMLSRTVSRTQLIILGGLTPADFDSIMPAPGELTPEQRAALPEQLLQFLQGLQGLQ